VALPRPATIHGRRIPLDARLPPQVPHVPPRPRGKTRRGGRQETTPAVTEGACATQPLPAAARSLVCAPTPPRPRWQLSVLPVVLPVPVPTTSGHRTANHGRRGAPQPLRLTLHAPPAHRARALSTPAPAPTPARRHPSSSPSPLGPPRHMLPPSGSNLECAHPLSLPPLQHLLAVLPFQVEHVIPFFQLLLFFSWTHCLFHESPHSFLSF